MKSEPAVIIGIIMAVLTLLNIAITPEQYEALTYIVNVFVILGGVAAIRSFVASRKTVRKKAGPFGEKAIFEEKA